MNEVKPKEYKYLYQKMLDDEVIRKAYKKLRKGKTKRKEIIYIDAHLDDEVAKMRRMIENTKPEGVPVENPKYAYKPCKHTPKIIREHGKTRVIYMPEIHEQWLHHIIIQVLQPIILRTSYQYSCGSFPKRGAHYGKRYLEKCIRKGAPMKYYAKLDIRHFYQNIRLDILMRELQIRIKDDWFLNIIAICLSEFKKGIPLGFYISQWLANYILEPVDKMVSATVDVFLRYMDDMTFFCNNKKKLHQIVIDIMKMLGRRFRLKLKSNHQIVRFHYTKKGIGKPLDMMGFVFYQNRTVIRKNIMLSATRLAAKLHKEKEAGRRYYLTHVKAMMSYMGWFGCTDTYDCYLAYIKPKIEVRRLKKIISISDRRLKKNESVETGNLRNAA